MKRISRKRPEAEAEPVVQGRRVNLRRRGGFSSSGLSDATVSEGTPVGGEDLNEQVRQLAVAPAAPPAALPAPDQPGEPSVNPSNTETFNPANRLEQVRRRSSEYEREYRLGLIHRMLMRNVPLDEIANELQVSVPTVMRDRNELKQRLREAAKELHIDEMVGHNMAYYDEVAAMSMRAASNASTPLPMRISAMRTALAANNDKHRFLQAAGVYDVLRFRRAPGGDGASDIQRMFNLTEELFANSNREQREAAPADPMGPFTAADIEHL